MMRKRMCCVMAKRNGNMFCTFWMTFPRFLTRPSAVRVRKRKSLFCFLSTTYNFMKSTRNSGSISTGCLGEFMTLEYSAIV